MPVLQLPAYRAEVPLIASVGQQLRQGDLGMLANLHQRVGDEWPGGADAPRRAWGRVISNDLELRQEGTAPASSQGRRHGLQAGTDLLADDGLRAGIYVGQLDGDMRVSGFARGIQNLPVGSNDLRSQYLGAYATWQSAGGWYADGVLQAARHWVAFTALGAARQSLDGHSLLGSLELGRSLPLGDGWMLEPQLQLTRGRLRLDDLGLPGATRVEQDNDATWRVRFGARLRGSVDTGWGPLRPYARIHLHHSLGASDEARFVTSAATTVIRNELGASTSEVAAGFSLAAGNALTLYGELGRLWALGGRARVASGVQGSIGLKVNW